MKKRFTIIEKICGLGILILILRLIVPAWALEFNRDKNVATYIQAPIINATDNVTFATGANNTKFYISAQDNNAAFGAWSVAGANITINSPKYNFPLNATEMNHQRIDVLYNGTGCLQQTFTINTDLKEVADAVQVQTDKMAFTVANKINANVYTWNGTAVSAPATAGIPDVNMKNIANAAVSTAAAQIGVNAVQIGAAVPGSATIGTVTSVTNNVTVTNCDVATSTRGTSTLTTSDNIGINWADVSNPTTAVNLSGTNIKTDQIVASVSGNVDGNVTGSVASVVGNVTNVTNPVSLNATIAY